MASEQFVRRFWLVASTGILVIVILVGTIFLFQYFQIYVSFIPVLLAVASHFLWEQVRDHRHLVRENVRLTEENAALMARLQMLRRDADV